MRSRRRKQDRDNPPDLLVKLCSVVGLLLGLLYGLEAPPAEPPRCGADPCVDEAFVAGLEPVLVPAGLGLAVGALVGLTLALAIGRRA